MTKMTKDEDTAALAAATHEATAAVRDAILALPNLLARALAGNSA